jgi:hypothetical protein
MTVIRGPAVGDPAVGDPAVGDIVTTTRSPNRTAVSMAAARPGRSWAPHLAAVQNVIS